VHKLQQHNAINHDAYLFSLGLDDQNPEDWNDHEVRKNLVVPDPSGPSSDEGGDPREERKCGSLSAQLGNGGSVLRVHRLGRDTIIVIMGVHRSAGVYSQPTHRVSTRKTIYLHSGNRSLERERGGEMQGKGTAEGFTIPFPVTSSSEEEEDLEHGMEEEQEEPKEATRKRKRT
jgi:hypothetical protein